MIILVEIDALNLATEQPETLRVASARYATSPDDDPASVIYERWLATSRLTIKQVLYASGTTGGASQVQASAVELLNLRPGGDPQGGALDHLREQYAFAGRPVRILTVPDATTPRSQAELVFTGTMEQPEWSWDKVSIRLRDRSADFDTPLQDTFFDGTATGAGGQGGSPSLAGKPWPVCLGAPRNITPALANEQLQIYKLSDRAIAAVQGVRDGGVALGANLVREWASAYIGDVQSISMELPLREGAMYSFHCWVMPSYMFPVEHLRISVYLGSFHAGTVEYNGVVGGSLDFLGIAGPTGTLSIEFEPDSQGVSLSDIWLGPFRYNHFNAASLEAAIVPPGGFHTCLAESLIRLGSRPEKGITCEVEGDPDAGLTVASIARHLATQYGKLAATEIDQGSLDALAASHAALYPAGGTVGLYLGSDATPTVKEVLDQLCGTLAWWGFGPDGTFRMGQLAKPAPGSGIATLDLDRQALDKPQIVASQDDARWPLWRATAQYARNHTVQGEGELLKAGNLTAYQFPTAVQDDFRAWTAQEWRTAAAENPATRAAYLLAGELSADTALTDESDGQVEADRQLAWFGGVGPELAIRLTVSVAAEALPANLAPGAALDVTSTRYGLSAGRTMVVLGAEHTYDAEGPATVRLDLVG